ncbi:MAG TPA: SgcJ/EcaC family oxidoreductase [Tepidisphaeraceae bacterium]
MSSQFGVGSAASTGQGHAPAQENDRRAIEQRIQDFAAAWNRHDPAQMALLWAEDGDLINPWGRVAKGRGQVQQVFRDEHQGMMKSCSHQMNIQSVRMIGDDTALVDGECTLSGARGADGKEIPTFKPHVFFVMNKKDGEWHAAAVRPYSFAPAPGPTA